MLSEKIIAWYEKNKRDLPWRNVKNPYHIWLSEVILQQTRVDQGLSYYLKFISLFPTVLDLASAEEELVLRTWQGLGYYSRARNLHKAAIYIHEQLGGHFPTTFETLKKLPGVGDYTAAAIASIAFNQKKAVVDGNVYRVLSRLFTIDTSIDSSLGKKEFAELAQSLISEHKPSSHNQGLMEIGALICKPKNPDCLNCPLSENCLAFAQKTQLKFPVKERKQKIKDRYFNYLVVRAEGKVLLQKRTNSGIWKNLFEFLLIETPVPVNEKEELSLQFPDWLKKIDCVEINKSSEKVHLLSHQKIHTKFWSINLKNIPSEQASNFYSDTKIESLPKHQLIVNYLIEESL